jgi:hypothetical protein
MKQITKYVFRVAILGLICVLFATAALGQCAMCRASLTGANNAAFIKNLNIGILVLLLPPVSIFCTIFIVAVRRRKAS